MVKSNKSESPFSLKFRHVGIIVKDIDKTVKRLEFMGIGPFEPFDPANLPPLAGPLMFRGKPYDGQVKTVVAKVGDVIFEIFEPLGGKSPWQEFLDDKGEGIHHIGFAMEDYDKDVGRFTEQNAIVVHSARQVNGGGSVYLDLGAGLVIELEKIN